MDDFESYFQMLETLPNAGARPKWLDENTKKVRRGQFELGNMGTSKNPVITYYFRDRIGDQEYAIFTLPPDHENPDRFIYVACESVANFGRRARFRIIPGEPPSVKLAQTSREAKLPIAQNDIAHIQSALTVGKIRQFNTYLDRLPTHAKKITPITEPAEEPAPSAQRIIDTIYEQRQQTARPRSSQRKR